MKGILIAILFSLFSILPGIGQAERYYERPYLSEVDSLTLALSNASNDTIRMELHRELGRFYFETNLRTAIYHHEQQLVYAREMEQKLWEADALRCIAHKLEELGEYSKSHEYYLAGIEIAENPQSEENIWHLYQFTPDGDGRSARIRVLAMLKIFLGVLNEQAGYYERAWELYEDGFVLAEEVIDTFLDSHLYAILGWDYWAKNDLDLAIENFEIAALYSQKPKLGFYEFFYLMGIADIYGEQDQLGLQKEYIWKAINSSIKYENPNGQANTYQKLARFHSQFGQRDSSIYYSKRSMNILLGTGDPRDIISVYSDLANEYSAMNQIDSAYKYQNLLLEGNDFLKSTDKSLQFVLRDFNDQNNKLEISAIEKSRKARSIRQALWVGLATFLVVVVLLYRNNRLKQKSNANLNRQKGELQEALNSLKKTQYDLIKSEKKAKTVSQELSKINALKDVLYTNITHEFRTPLTVIKGMTDSLQDQIAKDDLVGAEISLEMIQRNGNGLLRLVNEMLDFAKIESGQMEVNLVQSDVLPFIKHLVESFSAHALKSEIGLKTISKIESLIMDFDPDKMSIIFSNILSNAIKFTSDNGHIEIVIDCQEENNFKNFVVEIIDNGKGISTDDLPHIFDRYYQVNSSITREHEGTGIGLALSKDLIELMGGMISVSSEIGKGSTFKLVIPVRNEAVLVDNIKRNRENLDLSSLNSSQGLENKEVIIKSLPLVLIIEDNEDVATYLKSCFSQKYQTLHAKNGKMGIEQALEYIPDIIVSDVMMPEKDGLEVCSTLKTNELTNHIPIILLTAKATIQDRLIGLSHGADAYLSKPFNRKELLIRVEQLIALRHTIIAKFKQLDFGEGAVNQDQNLELKFIQRVINIINKEMINNDLRPALLAHRLALSESQIYRKIKAITGKSSSAFIRFIRLQKAKKLINETDLTFSQIAYEIGFTDPAYFSRVFKQEFGYSPKKYKETAS